ncbi:DNA-binding response OmpR family regulator [Clostridium acetobutylicum]|uniref:Stage 0 sporulation protein A homolog n=1 Tax=Clostridium acetobutylicum (strain ATCC 824 / DSM 792 / JCM 1419 / IAM 19013 / LMG 5710 / NBRC 13948 / NRRL B-527 / VKM B-1787 / 2291 / W) TaxID=272562 RepID=Q97LV4_CLOAB|nr:MULTISPECIES: response regulator transcription factor [Clostridium]AAK78430.1 Response regulator (CheY-like and HTH domains) [Clostridium acetobutylicum ATCC 824]ADZ19500.1 Response regulator (CheY-like and HTH domains) [Clostridium acetobutylicum EA 2018]AEI34422.1 response regulator [Clostridium acetobutylicum DSM 1731]AWV80152.1 DNA-binding response regulator [Clostridium acetobutylicum]MBC2392333.1 response regulator transcription factor [Clostridium acetobutylicum]
MAKILLVEDDEALSMGIKYTLLSEKFEVIATSSIEEAKEVFNNEKISLVLMDLMLPDGSGYDLCRELRKNSDIPIIFLTACDEEVNVVMGFDLGADDYITKPFKIKELISRIKAVLRRCSSREEVSELKSRDVLIDKRTLKAYKNDKEIVLTHMELKLLILFIENSGQTLKRNLILQRLWDISEEFVDDNTLSVYIKRLREKLKEDSKNPYIVTVRGIGYRWNGGGI